MWCYRHNVECYSSNNYCNNCSYEFSQILQFNYECPNCKGKFNYSVCKQILVDAGMYYQGGHYEYHYVCPFCGRLMEGLK